MEDAFLTFRLDLASALLTERANAVYRERCNLDVRALRVLRLVCAEPGVTPKAVSRRALVEKTLLSKILADLEARGLLGREAHAQDGRSVALRASREGRKMAKESERLGRALEADLVSALSDRQRETLDRLLAKLTNSLMAPVESAGRPLE